MPELPEDPLNREPEIDQLISSFITYENGYDRNHCDIPEKSGSEHRVKVDGAVKEILQLSVSDLRNDFEQHSVTCALQCAGNRRHGKTDVEKSAGTSRGYNVVCLRPAPRPTCC